MPDNTERYVKMLELALEIQQKEIEMDRLYWELSGVISISEVLKRVKNTPAENALKLMELKVERNLLEYKDVSVFVAERNREKGVEVFNACLSGINLEKLMNL